MNCSEALGLADQQHPLHCPSGVVLPDLWLAGPDGEQLSLPGLLWPQGLSMSGGGPIYFGPMDVKDANRLCELWGHPLGACNRPFGKDAWGMAVDGVAVAAAISATTASTTVNFSELGFPSMHRRELVDLARIARHPDHAGVIRVMLRLWRDYLGRRFRGSLEKWGDVEPQCAVSYALPGRKGNIYQFDGWKKVGRRKARAAGGYSNRSRAADMDDGWLTLWMYRYASGVAPSATKAESNEL